MNPETCIKKLTLEEKAALLQGWSTWTTRAVPRVSIPEIFLSDGPHGLRKQMGTPDHLGMNRSYPATCFPTAATMANSWDTELGQALGRALGEEAAAAGVNVLLGPGLNMKRSPLCGRNFEYFSEDPYLAGKMAAAYIRGIQENGVAACPKHFAVNSQELRRLAVDEVVDERTLREIYLTGFEIAVKEGKPKTIMSSYNMVNGTYANENSHLLTDILKKEWGFDGFVVSDWGADNDHPSGVQAGSALVMPAPGPSCAAELVDSVIEGRIPESALDDRLRELLPVIFSTTEAIKGHRSYDADAHHALARKCAEGAIVLLENDGILPLSPDAKVAVVGDFAAQPRYQGAGSSLVNPTRLDNLLDCAREGGLTVTGFARGYSRANPAPDQALIDEAIAVAKTGDAVLLCVGLDELSESEGMDRRTMALSPGQQALMDALLAEDRDVILVLSGGSPFLLPESGYRAAIHGYLGGQAGAGAMVDALLGRINPSGKLSESWPRRLEDNPSHPYYPSPERTAEHREGLYIGYRYYDTAGVDVRYPFGYGLSYTTFQYSGLTADKNGVTFTLTNTGSRDGAEIPQVYVSCRGGSVFRPKKELKGFAKVFLKAGERKTVTIPLDDKAFRYFNVKTNRWEVETANYDILVAAGVSDVKLSTTIRIFGTDAPDPYGYLPSYQSGRITAVSDGEFEALLGHPIPDGRWSGELRRNDALCQLTRARSLPARLMGKFLNWRQDRAAGNLDLLFVCNMPFRTLAKVSGGLISTAMVDDLVYLANGHFFRGTGRFIRDFFRNLTRRREYLKQLKEGPY